MAARGTINELYDLQSLDAQQQAVLAFVKQYVDQVKAASNVKIKLGGADSAKEITSAIKQLSDEQKKLVDLTLKLASAEDKYAAARLKNSKADTQDVKTKKEKADLEVKLAKEKERLIKLAEKEAKVIEKSNNEYIKLNEQYKIAAAASQKRGAELLKEANGNEKLFLSLLKTDKEYIATTKSAKTYFDQLTLLEQNVGKAQRNVGNYASAFNGLNTSFAQVARELPSLTISFQQFALAISNNLPIAVDEIQRARDEIAKLRAEGIQTPSLFKTILGSVFSFQVGLSVLITAFVALAPKISQFFGELTKGKDAVKDLNEEQKKLIDIYAQEKVQLDLLFRTATNANIPIEARKEAIKELRDNYGNYLKNFSDEEILAGKAAKAYNELSDAILRSARARAAQDLLIEGQKKILAEEEQIAKIRTKVQDDVLKATSSSEKAIESFTKTTDKRAPKRIQDIKSNTSALVNAIQEQGRKEANAVRDNIKKLEVDQNRLLAIVDGNQVKPFTVDTKTDKDAENAAKKLKEIRDKLAEDELAAQRALILLRLQNEADAQQRILESDKFTYEERINAANNFYNINRTLLQTELDQELAAIDKKAKDAKLGEEAVQNQKALVKLQFNGKFIDLERRLGDQILDITKANVDKEEKARLEALQKRLKAIENAGAIEVSQLQKKRDEEILALSERANATNLSFEEQQKERLKILVKYAKLELEAQLRKVEELIKLETDPVKRASLEAQAAAIRLKIDDDLTAEKVNNLKEIEAAEKKLADLQKQLQLELFTLVKTFTLGRFDAAKNQIQDQIDKTEEAKRKEIDAINATTLPAIEKQARITNAEKKAQAERERLELRQRQIDRQRAQFERAFSIAQIIAKTAEAVVKAVAASPLTGGLPFSAIIAAIGAAQIATVLASPIPRFKTGKGEYDKYEGPAWVGDGGKSEMIFRENGTMEKTPATPVLTWVGKNDIIHPDANALMNHTIKKQGEVMNYSVPGNYAFDEMTSTLKGELRSIKSAITNKREYYFNINNGKPSVMTKDGSRIKTYLNDNLQFGG